MNPEKPSEERKLVINEYIHDLRSEEKEQQRQVDSSIGILALAFLIVTFFKLPWGDGLLFWVPFGSFIANTITLVLILISHLTSIKAIRKKIFHYKDVIQGIKKDTHIKTTATTYLNRIALFTLAIGFLLFLWFLGLEAKANI